MLAVVGGIYRERCLRPNWDEFYGSAGRAASAICRLGGEVTLHCYLSPDARSVITERQSNEGFDLVATAAPDEVGFFYEHGLAHPKIARPKNHLPALYVRSEKVLRYGMLESTAIVDADYAVFDPQNVDGPEAFHKNGSTAKHLALVLNRYEARALLDGYNGTSLEDVAKKLAEREQAEVVIIKCGPRGALVWHNGKIAAVPAYETPRVWKIGSGDQFAANFAHAWMEERRDPLDAAHQASRATAFYCQHIGFPTADELHQYTPNPISVSERFVAGYHPKVYLAGPFFTLGQLWVVEQARNSLRDMGLNVFSPYHDVGPGEANDVVPKDINGIGECDLMLAIMDGTDAGTVFEVGYAYREGKPVVVYAEYETAENCKMMVGSGCFMCEDFVSSIYQTVWAAAAL
jgi:nucleoside 2-deoxyribosyltransferase